MWLPHSAPQMVPPGRMEAEQTETVTDLCKSGLPSRQGRSGASCCSGCGDARHLWDGGTGAAGLRNPTVATVGRAGARRGTDR